MCATPDPLSRRREVAATSARSLLLTVLGELVLPAGEPVWTQTLIDALALVDVEEKSARQALARTGADGVVASERVGRRVRWALSPSGLRLLHDGATRIYAHGSAPPDWDGRWVMLVASVPEQHRALRHRLRTRLAWAGMGSPSTGVWVRPHGGPGDVDAVHRVLDDLDLAAASHLVVGDYVGGLEPRALAATAWDLTDLRARYEAFLGRFAHLDPTDDTAVLGAQIRLVDDWRRFPFLDPQLPDDLLPPGWPGREAAAVFHARHAAWAAPSRRRFAQLGGH